VVAKNVIVVQDLTGKPVAVSFEAIWSALIENMDSVKILGMGIREIIELRNQYLRHRGPLDMTVETIKKTFESDQH